MVTLSPAGHALRRSGWVLARSARRAPVSWSWLVLAFTVMVIPGSSLLAYGAELAFSAVQRHAKDGDKGPHHHGHGDGHQKCEIIGDHFGFLVQGLLFAVAIGSLLLKWRLENPRRQFNIFCLDSSKQVVGAGVIHMLNMICAIIFSNFEASLADECAWYWVNIMIDTTFGVLVCWGLLKLTEALLGYDSGHYGKGAETGIDWERNPDYWKWGGQIGVWCVIVSFMKLVVVALMWLFASFWETVSMACTHWIRDRQLRLLFVMIITPTCMNMFQFWVTDSFLKFKQQPSQKGAEQLPESAEAGRKAL